RRRRRRAGEKGGAARAAGAAQGPRRAWRAPSWAHAGPLGAPPGRHGFSAGRCRQAASDRRPCIAGRRAPREKPACVGAQQRRRRAGFRPLPGPGGPTAGSEEPGDREARATAPSTGGCRPVPRGSGTRGRRQAKGRTTGAGPRPRPLHGRAEGSARLPPGPRSYSRGGRWGMRATAPRAPGPSPPGLRSCCSPVLSTPHPTSPPLGTRSFSAPRPPPSSPSRRLVRKTDAELRLGSICEPGGAARKDTSPSRLVRNSGPRLARREPGVRTCLRRAAAGADPLP
ncbi:PREDICTED: translation initiation factor IF-2-like, partial [Chinchilla lanigera]|uniref:translation initiation factor IF-2-like n=1 Tax=Chinchilla lanigera TaxID=34839 RepID=UPI000696D848